MSDTIIIDLHDSDNAREFNETLIHQQEIDRACSIIESRLMEGKNRPEERLHETIAILGPRGSGKTTFLLNVLKKYKNDDSKFCVLKIIDPTLIEEKAHIFLDVLSRIKEKVDKQLESIQANSERYQEWESEFTKLAAGLPQLDGLGGDMTGGSWQDAEYIMNTGLIAVKSAHHLEDNFHELVRYALDILKKEAFLIVFDDIDIDFRKGWRVLETIRKYFTTPKIVSLLSGDLELYLMAIRKQIWENFGETLLLNEGKRLARMGRFNHMATQMEGQYLQKIMPVDRRISLTTLSQKLAAKGSIMVKPSNGNPIDIKKYYEEVLKQFGILSELQAETYHSFLLNLPLRTQIQFMSVADTQGHGSSLTDPFVNELYEKNVDIGLAYGNSKFTNIVTLKLLLDQEALDEAYQLQPTLQDSSLNAALFALSMLTAQHIKDNPFLIFDYLIRVGYTRNLESALYTTEGEELRQYSPTIKGLARHAGLLQDKVLRDIVGLTNAYIRATLNSPQENMQPWGGTIILYTLNAIAKQSISAMTSRIDVVFKNDPNRSIAYIPLSIAQSSAKQSGVAIYSIYSLLATIGELSRNHAEREKGLYEFSQVRTYPMPEFTTGSNGRVPDFNDDRINDFQHPGENFQTLERLMTNWLRSFSGRPVSPHTLGKISTRFFYALINLERGSAKASTGAMFNLQIAAFLNAVLIEETKEMPGEFFRRLNLNNMDASFDNFLNNLKNVDGNGVTKNDMPLSRWLLSCPMFLIFLHPTIVKVISTFTQIDEANTLETLSVFDKLSQVSIRERPGRPGNRNRLFDEMIQVARANHLDHDYFSISGSYSSKASNKYIRDRFKPFFKQEQLGPGTLRQLREYVDQNNISW